MNDSLPLLDPVVTDQNQRSRILRPVLLHIQQRPARGPHHHRRKILFVSVTGCALLLGGTATAISVLRPEPVRVHDTARCYSEISSDFGESFPGGTIASPSSSNGDGGQVTAPIQACATLWQAGALPSRNPFTDPPTSNNYPVPELTGCVLPDGSAAVFPGPPDTCQKLGLPPALPG